MISVDSNLLLYAYDADCPFHQASWNFLESLSKADVVISEFSLVEFYGLLRNSAVLSEPLKPDEAVDVVAGYRNHPRWIVAGFPEGATKRLHDQLWKLAAQPGFAFRRIYDARLALVLREYGVKEFATANVKDFESFGFKRVWNPLVEPPDAL